VRGGLLVKVLAIAGPLVVIAAIVGFVVLVVGLAFLRSWLAMRRARAYAASVAEASVPAVPAVELWAAGAYGLWTGGEDCAGWPQDRARESLSSWYGANDAEGLESTVDGLMSGATGNPAWDQVRAVDLLRIGLAAGYLTPARAAERVREAAASLRATYPSWEALGQGFEAGMHAWQDSRGITDEGARGRVQRNLPGLRSGAWARIRYDAAL
jgi:hypothetical protein